MNQTTIGERIKYHRKRLGMTQEQLAERIGVSAQAVSKWENNLSCPDISILPELAALFGITVDELLGKNEPVHEAEPIGKDKGVEFNVSLGKGKKHGLLFAIYVIVFGALLLVNMLLPNPPSWWTVLWTTFLIYVGISSLCEHFSVFGTAATVIGLIFLSTRIMRCRCPASAGRSSFRSALCSGASVCSAIIISKRTANTARS